MILVIRRVLFQLGLLVAKCGLLTFTGSCVCVVC